MIILGIKRKKEKTVLVDIEWKENTVMEAKLTNMTIVTDSPPHERGERRGAGISATESFMLAIGRCTLVSILKAAKVMGIQINTLSAKVKMQVSEIEDQVYSFDNIKTYLKIDVNEKDNSQLEELLDSSKKYCSVVNAIKRSVVPTLKLQVK